MAALVRELRQSPSGQIGLVLLVIMLLMATIGAQLSSECALDQDLTQGRRPPLSAGHLLGTDGVGRDLLCRVVYASRISLLVGTVPVVTSSILGTLLGLLAGYYGGWYERIIMRAVDVQLAFPLVLIALVINAIIGVGFENLLIALTIVGWAEYARIVRGVTLSLRERDFVQASRSIGARDPRIILRHLLPNVASSILVIASLQVAVMILIEAAVSYLGFGVQPPTPSWGNLLTDAQLYVFTAWWLAVMPGVFLTLAVLGANLLGDFLRDALDPRLAAGG